MTNLLEVGVAFTLGSLTVKWYGIIIATGVLVAVLIACYNSKLKGYSKDFPYELLLWCFPLAIIGARVYYIIFSGQSYTFAEAIAIWNGGMAIYGGIIGGLIGLILYSIIKNKNLLLITDIVAPSLIIAQSIGRWGNFANQEVYGQVVTNTAQQWFPFAVYIERLGEWHYAMFFYESLLCLLGFILLMFLFKKTKTYGIVTATYVIFYGIVRFILEGMRQESEILFISGTKIPVSQVVSIGFVVVGLVILAVLLILARKRVRATVDTKQNSLESARTPQKTRLKSAKQNKDVAEVLSGEKDSKFHKNKGKKMASSIDGKPNVDDQKESINEKNPNL